MPLTSDTKSLAAHLGEAGAVDDVLPFAGGEPAAVPYQAGDVIAAKYRLTRVLGEGGMGAVWLARNLALDADVAVKLIRHDVATPEAAARLLREARSAAQLRHPAIVQIHDYGETERGDPFIVMEFLNGSSLGAVLNRDGRLPATYAVQLLLPVASALVAAHRKGVVHRDLKPDNIMLVPDERGMTTPKLVDFGIAKLKAGSMDGQVTQTGAVLGSPDYMSPEQARGRVEVDERTDVWALSVTLYEALTNTRPFEGVNYNALINSIIEDEPAPITAQSAGDAELWVILARGLEKDPAVRWQTVRELGEALAGWAVARGLIADLMGSSIALHWLAAPPPQVGAVASRRVPPYVAVETAASPGAPPKEPSGIVTPPPSSAHGGATVASREEAEGAPARDPGRSRRLWAAGVGAALALGLLFVALRGRGSNAGAPEAAGAATPAAMVPAAPVVASAPIVQAPASAASASASSPVPRPQVAPAPRRADPAAPRPAHAPLRPAPLASPLPLPSQPNF